MKVNVVEKASKEGTLLNEEGVQSFKLADFKLQHHALLINYAPCRPEGKEE